MSDDLELLMPFVTVSSKGGPHDDDSYVAGWEMAQLDNRLAYAKFGGFDAGTATLRRSNLPQVDLIAMKHGFIGTEIEFDPDNFEHPHLADDVRAEWALMQFTWAGGEGTLSEGGAS